MNLPSVGNILLKKRIVILWQYNQWFYLILQPYQPNQHILSK